jgi:5-methylthioadenosine/S-adenosylhomocysteine deaminase
MGTTLIRNAAWVVAWDAQAACHRYLRDGDVAFAEDEILFVGKAYQGHADTIVDGTDVMVMPGLINIHCHPRSQPILKGIIEELGSPRFYMSGLYDVKAAFRGDENAALAGAELVYAELLRSGVTSIVDISRPYPGWIDLIVRSGLRGFLAPTFAAAEWFTDDGHSLQYRWDEAEGWRAFERAQAVMDAAEKEPSRRLSALVAPDTLDTCGTDLLRDAIGLAKQTGRQMTIHCAESIVEFNEFTRRHGKTPIQYAVDHGLVGPHVILGHVIFHDQHSWLHWTPHRDLGLLAELQANVAHCPRPFARYGQTLEHLGRYLRCGINVGFGTDTFPHNLIDEMHLATTLARVAAEDMFSITTAEVFTAATVGGARSLSREDLGRLAPGMRADLVVVNIRHPDMRPLRDPLRSLIYSAGDRAVRDVYVAGRKVLADGCPIFLDPDDAASRLEAAQRRAEQGAPDRDYLRRSGHEISPLTLSFLDAGLELGLDSGGVPADGDV